MISTPVPAPSVTLLERAIFERRAEVGLIGLGSRAASLAARLVEQSFFVVGFGLSPSRQAAFTAALSQRFQPGAEFDATPDLAQVAGCSIVFVDCGVVEAELDRIVVEIERRLRPGHLIVFIGAGARRRMLASTLEAKGLVPGRDDLVAFRDEVTDIEPAGDPAALLLALLSAARDEGRPGWYEASGAVPIRPSL